MTRRIQIDLNCDEVSYPVLFETVVGSHAWGMQRPDSDLENLDNAVRMR